MQGKESELHGRAWFVPPNKNARAMAGHRLKGRRLEGRLPQWRYMQMTYNGEVYQNQQGRWLIPSTAFCPRLKLIVHCLGLMVTSDHNKFIWPVSTSRPNYRGGV